MTEATKRKDLDLDYFLHPTRAFRTPMDVMTDPDMTVDDIMDALKQLDGDVASISAYGKFLDRARRWKHLYRSDPGSQSILA